MLKKTGGSVLLLTAILVMAVSIISGCGGGGSTNAVVNDQIPLSGSNSVIADSVKIEKSGDSVTVNYQTSIPVKKAHIVTSNFSFNNAPLWSEFNEVKTENGLKHTCTFKTSDNKCFMIFAGPQDKFDNGGRGIEIK